MGMAMNTGGGGGSRRRRRSSAMQPVSEINVTPFVDVMLVLLIIFMITATVSLIGVPVNKSEASGAAISTDTKPISITVTQSGEIFLNKTPMTLEQLSQTLTAQNAENPDKALFVIGDQNALYGGISKVMGVAYTAGFRKLNFITNPDKAAQ